jgi:hypothetical protein
MHSFTRLSCYSDADDGSTKLFGLDRPFYALDTAGRLNAPSDSLRTDVRYALGERSATSSIGTSTTN